MPFDVNSITKRDLGNKALTTLFLTGSKIVVIMALGGIVFKNLDMAGFGEVTFKELKYETIFLFITVGMVMAFIMNEHLSPFYFSKSKTSERHVSRGFQN